ncbi:MAG: ABC transporter permease [Treponema sp.]|nr:ABC transporter permease [Treponema sp.]
MKYKSFPYPTITIPAIGISLSLIIILLQAQNPIAAISDFIGSTFTSLYYFGTMLNMASLYMIAGTGAVLAIKSGNLNLGGEGQIYTGGFIGCTLLTATSFLPAPLSFFIAIAAVILLCSLLTCFSSFLRLKKKANILLTSYLVSAAIIPCIDALIAGPFRDTRGNLLATVPIPESLQFPLLLSPSPLSITIFIAPLFCIALWYFLCKTTAGKKCTIWGIAPEFALYCGYSLPASLYIPLAFSGALHGLTGFFAICGTYYTCHSGFYSGIGWSALTCALIANKSPLHLIPASIIIAWLVTSADRTALLQNFGFDISSLLQGIILFCISCTYISRRRHT